MNQYPTAIAKVTRPVLPDIFLRKRLFDLLDDLRKRPIIWVSGPPGCGKTTLIGSYIETQQISCLWYNLDEGDTDPATFFYYMGLAIEKVVPRMRNSLPLLTPEYLPGISTFTRRYFENLCSQIKNPGVIVFDNYQDVPAECEIHEVISTGLSAISEGINVILISRSQPPANFIRYKANRMLQSIGWDQLRFTLDETQEFLKVNDTKKRLPKKTIEHLHRTADGWVAGLVLMMETAKGEVFEPRQINEMTQRDVFGYFTNELFDNADERIQAFLLKTAFMPEMTRKMAEELTGWPTAGRILSRLNQTHFFTEKRSHQKEPVYQYHPLFREFLLKKAAIALSPEKLAGLRNIAAVLLERVGQIEAAVKLYRENEKWEEMIRLIMHQAPLLLKQGRNIILEKWLTSIPSEIFEKNPWLHYWLGACCFPVNPSRSQSYLKMAYRKFKGRGDVSGTFLVWSGMVDAISFEFEDLTQLDQWIYELETRMGEYGQLLNDEIKARVAISMFFALFVRQPHHPELKTWAEKALSFTTKELDENTKALSLFNLAHHKMMNGEMDTVESFLFEMNQLADTPTASPLTRIKAKFVATAYYQGTGFYADCLKCMKEGLEISKKTGVHVWDAWLLAYGAAGALNHGDYKTASRLIEKMSAYLDRMKSWEMSGYHFLKAREALIRGDLAKADVHVNLSLEMAKKVGVIQKFNWPLILKAQVMHALHKHKEADEDLSLVFANNRRTKSNLFKFHALMIEAQFAYDRGKPADGLESLRKALALGKDQKYLNIFADDPAVTAKLCARALKAGIEVDYVQEIIRRRQLIPDEPPIHLENWPWALKIFTLGRFGLLSDGKPLKFTRKAQEKPLALLKCLIAYGGREVHEEQIADALWQDADGDLAHKSFATTLWRLRKLIGCPDAIQLSDRKLTLDPRYCWVDVWAFERLIRQAEVAWKQDTKESDLAHAISLIQNALDIYQGPFLTAENDAYWAISLRERLQNRFLRMVKRLCEYWKKAGQHEKAVECYQQSIEVDDLIDGFYLDLMTCYWQLGRRTDALSTYERYKETVSSKLGIEPSREASRLRKAIVSELNSNT
jgi:ATP/maltotriose-dependent transcriptional regulator MalT/DNA-binding SARP family transcriptional activator